MIVNDTYLNNAAEEGGALHVYARNLNIVRTSFCNNKILSFINTEAALISFISAIVKVFDCTMIDNQG